MGKKFITLNRITSPAYLCEKELKFLKNLTLSQERILQKGRRRGALGALLPGDFPNKKFENGAAPDHKVRPSDFKIAFWQMLPRLGLRTGRFHTSFD